MYEYYYVAGRKMDLLLYCATRVKGGNAFK
jgi:hypothetical protein